MPNRDVSRALGLKDASRRALRRNGGLGVVGTLDLSQLRANEFLARPLMPRKKGGQPGNHNRMDTGIYTNRFLCEEERKEFMATVSRLHRSHPGLGKQGMGHFRLIALYRLKRQRALWAGDSGALMRFVRYQRRHLTIVCRMSSDLRRKIEDSLIPGPEEWAKKLLAQEIVTETEVDDPPSEQ